MKIAFLAAANSIHSVRWIKFFAKRGHRVTWVSLAPPIAEAEDLIKNVSFYEIKPSPLSDINGPFAIYALPPAVTRLKGVLKETKPDLLHIHSAGMYGLVGALTGFHPTILTPWGTDILLNTGVKKMLARYVVRSADAYTCDGENTRAKLIEFGAKPEKINLIRFGTDVERFRPAENRKRKMGKGIKVISLRSLAPIYDIETLIRAAKIVSAKAKKVEFVIAGGGEERERLEKLSRDLGIEKNVKFLGKVNNEELPALIQSADIYVSTALSDSGLSASTAEAMASGLPVIVTDTGDNKEWMDNEFVIAVKSPQILAEKIISLVRNERLRKEQGRRNRKIIKEKNNYYIEMAKVEKLYEEIIANR